MTDTAIVDISQQEQSSNKQNMGKLLFNHLQPRMITFLYPEEIEKLSILSVLAREENTYRKDHKLDNNPIAEILGEIFILRCSQKGWRADQGVEILKSVMDSDENKGFIDNFRNAMRR